MPVKSKSQWRRLGAMLDRGEITKAKFDEWTEGVSYDSLSERIGKKKRVAKKHKKKAKKKAKRV